MLHLPHQFNGVTTIQPHSNWLDRYLLDTEDILPDRGNQIEVPAFGKKFETYSTHSEEAQKIMSTSFPKKWLRVAKVLAKKKPSCSLYENKLLILFSFSTDLFEPDSIFKPVGCDENIFQIRQEIESILQIVDLLLKKR